MGCVAVVEWRLGCVIMVAHITVLVVLAKSPLIIATSPDRSGLDT